MYDSGLMLKAVSEFAFSLIHIPPGLDVYIENVQIGLEYLLFVF